MKNCINCEYTFAYCNRCPNYESDSSEICSICGDTIYIGEEYITNNDGENAHWECIDSRDNFENFLGIEVKKWR